MKRTTYRGRRLLVKKSPAWGRIRTYVNGQMVSEPYGVGAEAEARELDSLQRWVDLADERGPDAFPAYWFEGKTD